jgi:DNA repair protein RecN (Recombination protein N)
MLQHLEISHYALIERLDIDIHKGFSVITGETGAGKSIIMGALSLVLGNRADTRVIQEGAKKCVVEATFDVSAYGLEAIFDLLEIDYENECIIRREVNRSGKSRSFVNDTPIKLVDLKQITAHLIDIHSQHANLLLGESNFQLQVVDTIAQSKEELLAYKKVYKAYKVSEKALNELRERACTQRADLDYAQYQYDQLADAELKSGEQKQMEQELSMLNHAEEIKSNLQHVLSIFQDDEYGSLGQLREASGALDKVSEYLEALPDLAKRTESMRIELEDICCELENVFDTAEYDPSRKQQIEERLNLIYSLEQKHQVETIDALLELQNQYEQQLLRIEGFDAELEKLEKELQENRNNCKTQAEKLSQKRHQVSTEIEQSMEEKLVFLGMKNAQFKVDISTNSEFTPSGCDHVEFLFTANKKAQAQAITAIASGGEMARVMLTLKSLLVKRQDMPTIIFDEIDTGVSGDVAQRMGKVMQQMSQNMQVITISHLPQIAAQGEHHFKVYKEDTPENTITHLVPLNKAQRIEELAEMLSGKPPTPAACMNAQELIESLK